MDEKIRVLFVDDEPFVLQGLRRLLRDMRGEWEMSFEASGAEGLVTLAATPFDVVVTDLRMPGMNGAEFLNRVRDLYPETIRLVLSGHAEMDLILQAEGAAHQFLTKPCDPDLLRSVIRGASLVGRNLKGHAIRKILGGISHLPVIPGTYLEIQKLLTSETTTVADLGAVVQRDPGLTANILKLVNSSYFGLRQRVSSPTEAVSFLGVETLKAISLLHGVFQQMKGSPPEFRCLHLWSHSLGMARASQAIAALEGLDRTGRSDSFTSGLLHDVGLLLLISALPEHYNQIYRMVAEGPLEIAEAETQVMGIHHGEVGGYLLGLWGLPNAVVEAVSRHHDRFDPEKTINPTSIIQGAEFLSMAQGDRMVFDIHRKLGPLEPASLAGDRLQAWKAVADPFFNPEAILE
ncbi:HDOD domain-containing protein [Geothrix sp. 21YS21S-2]|uniref:HDOD domain-containing protein n=1 Tax=Geothrix sp. 21YS21S-2 TaxID=3068893 RepID=UPI0027B9D26A|nr:HDOD domain-containing protein [Geothrix sp. 21YS21S-2]